MQAPILPVSIANPFLTTPSSSSSSASSSPVSIMPVSSAAAGTIFIRSENNGGGSDDDDDGVLPTSRLLSHSSSPEDGAKPFLPRASSYDNGASSTAASLSYQQRRRRIASDSTLSSDGHRRRSFGQNVGQAGADTFFLSRLCLNLMRYIGLGYRWISRFLALGCYAVLLIPGFFQVGYRYFYSSRIRRGIVYGNLPRNKLDLYLPENSDGLKPVIAFITGGAWIIGYKAWGSLLGQQLSDRDIIVACIDYRNFPQVTIGDMVKDASQGISYVCNNISEYGGDPKRIYVMGQSAGAHIAACAILEKAIKESSGKDSSSWSLSQISAYLGLSGGYNLLNLVDHFHSRGLYSSLFCSIMEGEESLRRYSPEIVVQGSNVKNAVSLLPSIILFHGTADYSIPSDASKTFVDTLQRLGVEAELILYEGKTHTDVFLQDPMRGDDKMFDDLVGILHAGDSEALAKHAKARPRKRLVPEFMLQLARKVSPF